jgi:hypothetical protein
MPSRSGLDPPQPLRTWGTMAWGESKQARAARTPLCDSPDAALLYASMSSGSPGHGQGEIPVGRVM